MTRSFPLADLEMCGRIRRVRGFGPEVMLACRTALVRARADAEKETFPMVWSVMSSERRAHAKVSILLIPLIFLGHEIQGRILRPWIRLGG